MNRAVPAITAALALALTGCGGDNPEPAAAPATSSPAPAVDFTRTACSRVSTVSDLEGPAELDGNVGVPVAESAQLATNPAVAEAGRVLEGAYQPQPGDTTHDFALRVQRAWLGLAEACGNLYGDGPW